MILLPWCRRWNKAGWCHCIKTKKRKREVKLESFFFVFLGPTYETDSSNNMPTQPRPWLTTDSCILHQVTVEQPTQKSESKNFFTLTQVHIQGDKKTLCLCWDLNILMHSLIIRSFKWTYSNKKEISAPQIYIRRILKIYAFMIFHCIRFFFSLHLHFECRKRKNQTFSGLHGALTCNIYIYIFLLITFSISFQKCISLPLCRLLIISFN